MKYNEFDTYGFRLKLGLSKPFFLRKRYILVKSDYNTLRTLRKSRVLEWSLILLKLLK
jgi:hypothetical protein